jgi:uncharacterized protein YunC (DUF1805 family)
MVNPDRDARRDEGDDEQFYLLNVRRWQAERRPKLRRGVTLPSLLTMGNMFCGYLCVLYAIRGQFDVAAPLIGVAVVLDMLDGRIARMTGTATAFGVEFDSLADVISSTRRRPTFMWGRPAAAGWAAASSQRAAIRLARFNIQSVTSTDKRHFVGMPVRRRPPCPRRPCSSTPRVPDHVGVGRAGGHGGARAPMVARSVNSFKTIDTQRRRSIRCSRWSRRQAVIYFTRTSCRSACILYAGGAGGAVWAGSAGARRRQPEAGG